MLLGLILAACSGTDDDDATADDSSGSLVDHDAWTLVSAADDPFDDRPADLECSDLSWSNEDLGGEPSLEVATDSCDYLTVSQPSRAAGAAGDELHVRLWHYSLNNFEEAEAHAAITIGGEVVFEVEHEIPGDSGMDAPYWEAPSDFDAGDEVLFHLHNHGSNTWNFIELSVAAP